MSLPGFVGELPPQGQIDFLQQAVQDLFTSGYLDVAAVTCMLYDVMITIDQEVSLVWPTRWSLGKVAYFLTRYPVMIEGILWLIYSVDRNASESFCEFEGLFGTWTTTLFLIPLQIVVILRVSAIWERNRKVVVFLWFMFFVTDIDALVSLSRTTHAISFSVNEPFRPVLGCLSGLLGLSLSSTLSIQAWAPIIAFDTSIFLLTLAKGIRLYQYDARTRLINVLLRDGFAYYCVMLSLAVANLILETSMPLRRAILAPALSPVIRCSYSIIGSRLALNLRSAASQTELLSIPSILDDSDVR